MPPEASSDALTSGLPGGEARYRLLLEAGAQLSSTLDSVSVFERLRSIVSRAMPCDGLIVSSYDPSEGLIRCEYAYSGGTVLDHTGLPPLELGPPGTGMQSEVIRSGNPMLFGDVAQRVKDPSGKFMHIDPSGSVHDLPESGPVPTQSAIMVPILLDGQVTGVVQVMTDQGGAYGPEHLELLGGIVFLLGAAMQNAKLYAKVQKELIERKRAEAALRESEAKFRFFAETGPGCAWTTDADFNLQFANQNWLSFLGLDESSPADGWKKAIHPDDRERFFQAADRAKQSRGEFKFKCRIRTATGAYRWVEAQAQPDIDEDNRLRGWFGVTIDIEEHKEAEAFLEERVRARTQQLEAANREMEGFTYSVSHDLRGPLRAIMSTSMILKEDYGQNLPSEATDQLDRQAKAARKMGDLIDDLLKLSRIGRQEITLTTVNLSELAEEILAELQKDVQVTIEPDLRVSADPKLIKLALQNLLDNAIKFTKAGQVPVVELGREESGVIYVRDTGIGFDMEYIEKLFLPFERLVSDSEYPGTGIGLANCRRIIERHAGKIWAEGKPGEGATFYFTLPSAG